MIQSTFLWEEPHANLSQSLDCEKDSKTQGATSCSPMLEFLTNLNPNGAFGKMSRVSSVATEDGILVPSSGRWSNSGMGFHTESLTLNTLEYHSGAVESSLLDVLETGSIQQRFFLSQKACLGILRRAEERKRELPKALKVALQTGSTQSEP